MKINNYLIFLNLIFFISYNLSGQKLNPQTVDAENKKTILNAEFCGTDFFHNQKMNDDVAYRKRHIESIESNKKIISQQFKKSAEGISKIPIVVHVMHKGEAVGNGTNISDEAVKKGIKYLNNYWRKVFGSSGYGSGVDMKIEFVLAIQDPNGKTTNGIDRVNMSNVPAYVSNGVNYSENSGIGDYINGGGVNSLKEYSIWDPTKYYNVWIVDEIDNKNCFSGGSYTAGYAYYASQHGQPYDGSVVLICSYLDSSSYTWAHEMGHMLNLPHTFNGDIPNSNTCGDDNIEDTPKHIRTSSITPSIYFNCSNNGPNSCDPTFNKVINPDTGFSRNSGTHQDHMHNYMDYTGCANEFTGGQRAVTSAALSVNRASFLSSPALNPTAPATVYFTSSANIVCLGSQISFYDESANTPNTYTNSIYNNISFLWTFNNNAGHTFSSTLQNPTIIFDNLGVYDVTLAITNPKGISSLQKLGNIAVTSGVTAGCLLTGNSTTNNDIGVTKVRFNSINNTTSTFIPINAMNDFICSNNTTLFSGTAYDLSVNYKSKAGGSQFLEVWIDWNNNGIFEKTNNERVLSENIPESSTGSPTVSVIPPSNVVLNTMLRMRVVSEYTKAPSVCSNGLGQRADDYGVFVKAACTPPSALITNNSSATVLTCASPSINLTATGGASYFWNNNKGITPTIAVTEPGTYAVTVTSANGCTDTESIVITENKPAPNTFITNNTGSTAITCAVSSVSITASGGVSYSWDNGLGTNASATITNPGIYTVTVTDSNSCTASKSIVITDERATPACAITSSNAGNNYGVGVTNVTLNTINKTTNTNIPESAMQNFVCTDNTTLNIGTAYNLNVSYKSITQYTQYLEVWIDWNNNGIFETVNSNNVNERVLQDNIPVSTSKTATISITPPATSTKNTLLRMRVISEATSAPTICGNGFVKRADDYGVMVTDPLSTSNFLNSELKIYPNPVKSNLTVSLKNNDEIISYQIYDVMGKNVMSNAKMENNTIQVSALTNGIYFIKIKTTTGEMVSKFIKE